MRGKIIVKKPTNAKFKFFYAWGYDKSTIPYDTINYFTVMEWCIHHFCQWFGHDIFDVGANEFLTALSSQLTKAGIMIHKTLVE